MGRSLTYLRVSKVCDVISCWYYYALSTQLFVIPKFVRTPFIFYYTFRLPHLSGLHLCMAISTDIFSCACYNPTSLYLLVVMYYQQALFNCIQNRVDIGAEVRICLIISRTLDTSCISYTYTTTNRSMENTRFLSFIK